MTPQERYEKWQKDNSLKNNLIPYAIQNRSKWDAELPTILILYGDEQWDQAWENLRQNKNPTDSPKWKEGIFVIYEPRG